MVAGHWPQATALIGAAIVMTFYALVGGRTYCSWVCPINPITDLAAWFRLRLGIRGGAHLSRDTRYWILAMTLVISGVTGTVAWEWINPVTMLHRGLLFGSTLVWAFVLIVFLFDLFVMQRGWCGRLCPVGAAYSLIGYKGAVRVSAKKRSACNDCADCYAVCPEPLILKIPLKGGPTGASPVVLSPHCTNCGRCIDVCSKDVFFFSTRFDKTSCAGQDTASVQSQPSV
jgi:ferredoxin-type protein NapH